jgi:hypothetical protein
MAVFGYLIRRISFSIRLMRTAAISAVEQVLPIGQPIGASASTPGGATSDANFEMKGALASL